MCPIWAINRLSELISYTEYFCWCGIVETQKRNAHYFGQNIRTIPRLIKSNEMIDIMLFHDAHFLDLTDMNLMCFICACVVLLFLRK